MSVLPLTRTKDETTKEPAFIVLGKTLKYVLGLLIVIGICVTALFYQENSRYDAVKLRLHGVARSLNLAEHEHLAAHAEIAKVGEEFEEHLDRDLRELEAAQRALRNVRTQQGEFERNMTAIVHEALSGAIQATEANPGDAVSILTATKAELEVKLSAAMGRLFSSQNEAVEGLVRRLAAGAKEAVGRREGLQEEILHNLHEHHGGGGEGGGSLDNYLDDPDQTWLEGPEGDAGATTDDQWAKTTELWHNETVMVFFEKLHEWLHPPPPNDSEEAEEKGGGGGAAKSGGAGAGDNSTTTEGGEVSGEGRDGHQHRPQRAPDASYTNTSTLFVALMKARQEVEEEVGKWRGAQKLIHERAAEIKSLGLPAYTDADEPEDDGYQGFQSWHVQSYLDDLLWPALLRSKLPELTALKGRLDRGEVLPVDSVEYLEGLAAANVVPHHWLHHGGGHEYYYGGSGRDDFY